MAVLVWAAPDLLEPLKRNSSYLPHADPLAALWRWTSPWFRFDARWYVDVAQHGYHYGAIAHTNTNFYPLYPLLIRLVEPLTLGSPWIAALLVSNLSFLGALILFWRWAARRWGRRVAFRATLLLLVFPFSFFFSAAYAESLFLALAIAAFQAAEEERWGIAVVAAALASVTRPVGIAVVCALVVLAAERRLGHRALLAVLGFLPFGLFVLYLGVVTGHPWAFTVYHTYGWVPPHGGILTTVTCQFHTKLSPFDRVDVLAAGAFLLSAIGVWQRVGRPYSLYVLMGTLLPLIRGLAGMERYVIVLFPVFATWATWRSKVIQALLFAFFLFSLIAATAMFADGYAIF
jgi:hypothetical protein